MKHVMVLICLCKGFPEIYEGTKEIQKNTWNRLNSDNYINRYSTELSGGEKQRICIAGPLAAKPTLIIYDEVTSAQDQLVAKGILKLLQDLQNKLNVPYLFITHDLATVKAIADEIVVMLNGRIVERGVKKEVLKPPPHEYTEVLLSSVQKMDPSCYFS